MKRGNEKMTCRACGKKPALKADLGICRECAKHVYIDTRSGEVKDPVTKKTWPLTYLLSSQGLSLR